VSRALKFALVGLVVTNLGFAYVTEVARWVWLGPLLALTMISPVLMRWSDRRAYRWVWNTAVVGALALLIRHLLEEGSAHLLEDGLLLATLCQVHLLNNLGRRQQPDLLFFNSFLIAIVTSFLSVDFGYSVVFLCYAPLLVLSLQLLSLERENSAASPDRVRRVIVSGSTRAVTVVAITMVVFFLMPRDFTRKGFFGRDLKLQPPGGLSEVDFSKNVRLGDLGNVKASNRIVLRVRLVSGARHNVPQHWRGATLDAFDGAQWHEAAVHRVLVGNGWRPFRSGAQSTWTRRAPAGGAQVVVDRVSDTGDRMPVPLASRAVRIGGPDRLRVHASRDGTFRARRGVPRKYTVEVVGGVEGGASAPKPRLGAKAWTHLHVRPDTVPDAAREIGNIVRKRVGASAGHAAVVEGVRDHLVNRFDYLAPGADGGAESIGDFLAGARAGHCEYFASAMVLILRTQGVPCRLVTGFRSDEWDDATDTLLIRSRHAHAWVEFFDISRGWRTVDPTPAVDSEEAVAGLGLLTRLRYRLSTLWYSVTGFNATAAEGVRAWLAAHGWDVLSAALGLIVVALLLRLSRRRRRPAPVRAYGSALRRFGLKLEPGETPRELLVRVELDDERRRALLAATRAHEASRYAS
jgi:transglutaminase-like putative cysteine protease